jgi:hypothetical protein
MLMATHPEEQKLGRDEIFSVVGEGRLPTIADRDDLPYVMAIIKETMRWQVVLPLSEICDSWCRPKIDSGVQAFLGVLPKMMFTKVCRKQALKVRS